MASRVMACESLLWKRLEAPQAGVQGMLTPAELQSYLESNFGLESFCSFHMNLHFKTKTFTQETKHLYSTFFVPFIAIWGSITSVYVDLYSTLNAVNYHQVKQHITW